MKRSGKVLATVFKTLALGVMGMALAAHCSLAAAAAPKSKEKPKARNSAAKNAAQISPQLLIEQGLRLADRLRPTAQSKVLETAARELSDLSKRLSEMERSGPLSPDRAKKINEDARRLTRRIAFSNPLLKIDKLLFIKRHDAGGPFHMCDQFYGCNAKSGGGLFVLSDPFGDAPRLTNLLENTVVENGRLQGKKLQGGSFLSPEVSFDGKTILFAYSECQAKETYQWAPEYSYHIFKANADGTGLRQLTDGADDDFDPCFLPNGRILFITTRRGGYLRCGRHCPVYTMFSMEPDGSDIIPISFHETHEWQPSINHEGKIVYTRWDYVDRDTNIAHHLWTCLPDGRDPRSSHGNYPLGELGKSARNKRPWMEMNIRAIPGSHKYVATAAAHHGHAFGSLVLIDQRIEDDFGMSQLTRLTPDVPFPEAEGKPSENMCYGTPWPLSEEDYLVAYDRAGKNHGLYWVDRDGNRELIYRDPKIGSQDPIPLRARAMPTVIPDGTIQTAKAKQSPDADRLATISVMNIFDSDFDWPPNVKITYLRIIQLLPKSTPPPNKPRVGVANQTNARAVLGVVPVEPDGSVHFEAPVGMPIYFQAINEQGLAVQSMRSVTYVHPGENLTCLGCHEPKHRPSPTAARRPLALQRAPSKIMPDVEGSNPFNYPRLVQPALDRSCVGCHKREKALDLSGGVEKNGFTRSYNNLAGEYGFYFHVSNGSIGDGVHGGSRTIPGKFGAQAAPLTEYLEEKHYGVNLSEEDRHRITLWLDSNSEFLGAYEKPAEQARGEMVRPSLQ